MPGIFAKDYTSFIFHASPTISISFRALVEVATPGVVCSRNALSAPLVHG